MRILKHFNTAQEWLLEAGDMLYLPPHLAHWGIAVTDGKTDCMTYSIGFRAPKQQELASEFLGFMQDKINQETTAYAGVYQDPDLTLQAHPAEISDDMVNKVSAMLSAIQWSSQDVATFLGTYLSEPKADVVFEANKQMKLATFREKIAKTGLCLDLKSQMLFFSNHFFINGEWADFFGTSAERLKALANHRSLDATSIEDDKLLQQLYDWYIVGYINIR